MLKLLIAIVLGVLLAYGASQLTSVALIGLTAGTPVNAPLHNYGQG